ncbi:MAG: BACON domain-containing protein, partial [Bacteroidales bacterium]|nr:BACON domain-containing protein [Bacteroidales bacterium]
LHVVANAAWTLTASAGATVSPASGSADAAVTVSFAANTDSQAKTYTLTLACPDASVNQTITITQAAAGGGGGGTVAYTLDGTITGGTNSYAEASDITQNSVSWKVMGNTTMSPWRIGGKSLTNEKRTVYSTSAISSNISKIVVTHGTADGVTVNSMTITVHSSAADAASGANAKASFTPTFAASGAVTATKSGSDSWAGCYYRIVYDITVSSSSANKFLQFVKAEFSE